MVKRSSAVPPEGRDSQDGLLRGNPVICDLSSKWRMLVDNLLVEQLSENEFAIFNPEFDDSSLINAVDARLLEILIAAAPSSVGTSDLLSSIARSFGVEVNRDLQQYCLRALGEMQTIGLIHRANH